MIERRYMASERSLTALVVDDEKVIRDFLIKFLKMYDIEARCAKDGDGAIELARTEKFDVIFLDVRMPKMDGLEALRKLKRLNPEARYVMMTGYAVDDLLEEAKKEGIAASIKKPFEIDEITREINNIRA